MTDRLISQTVSCRNIVINKGYRFLVINPYSGIKVINLYSGMKYMIHFPVVQRVTFYVW